MVEVDLEAKLPEVICFNAKDYKTKFQIEFERRPPFCDLCKIVRHSLMNCRVMKSQVSQPNNDGCTEFRRGKKDKSNTFENPDPFNKKSEVWVENATLLGENSGTVWAQLVDEDEEATLDQRIQEEIEKLVLDACDQPQLSTVLDDSCFRNSTESGHIIADSADPYNGSSREESGIDDLVHIDAVGQCTKKPADMTPKDLMVLSGESPVLVNAQLAPVTNNVNFLVPSEDNSSKDLQSNKNFSKETVASESTLTAPVECTVTHVTNPLMDSRGSHIDTPLNAKAPETNQVRRGFSFLFVMLPRFRKQVVTTLLATLRSRVIFRLMVYTDNLDALLRYSGKPRFQDGSK